MKNKSVNNDHLPFISVVIPAYNSEKTISSALDSIKNQSYIHLIKEVIIVNDGSSDNTLSTLKSYSYAQDINLITINQHNLGPSAARNRGIKKSSGKWIAFLDSDDTWHPNKIERQVKCIQKYTDIKFISTNSNKIQSNQGTLAEENLRRFNVLSYFAVSRIPTSSVMIEKNALFEANLFNEEMKYAEDQNLFMKIISKYDAYQITENLTCLADKPVFGAEGLSSNLLKMHRGVLFNLHQAQQTQIISRLNYIALSMLERMKYLRRRLVTNKYKKLGSAR